MTTTMTAASAENPMSAALADLRAHDRATRDLLADLVQRGRQLAEQRFMNGTLDVAGDQSRRRDCDRIAALLADLAALWLDHDVTTVPAYDRLQHRLMRLLIPRGKYALVRIDDAALTTKVDVAQFDDECLRIPRQKPARPKVALNGRV